jgi:nicotinamidase-related amidase
MIRIIIIGLSYIFSIHQISAQPGLSEKALVLIDIQDFYFPGGHLPLAGADSAAAKAFILLDYFRKEGGLVVHIKHAYEPGGSIREIVKPTENEKVITKTEVNAFLNTDLDAYLRSHEKTELVLAGMQTHMCLEAATRAARDLGYACTVIADACATRDLKYGDRIVAAADVHASTLSTLERTYSRVFTTENFLEILQQQ